jgi:hypothetical protein
MWHSLSVALDEWSSVLTVRIVGSKYTTGLHEAAYVVSCEDV